MCTHTHTQNTHTQVCADGRYAEYLADVIRRAVSLATAEGLVYLYYYYLYCLLLLLTVSLATAEGLRLIYHYYYCIYYC